MIQCINSVLVFLEMTKPKHDCNCVFYYYYILKLIHAYCIHKLTLMLNIIQLKNTIYKLQEMETHRCFPHLSKYCNKVVI